jgi:hypothetical protein
MFRKLHVVVSLVFLLLVPCAAAAAQEFPSEDISSIVNRATAGDGVAQDALGLCYETGRGVPRDLQQARYWYEKALANGIRSASVDLLRLNGPGANASPQGAGQNFPVASVSLQAPQSQPAEDRQSDLEQRKDEIASKIEELQSDKDEQESEAEDSDQQAENMRDTSNCSGPSAAICVGLAQIGVNKFEAEARKARRAAQRDQEQIDELQGESNNLAQQQTSESSTASQQPSYDPNALVNLGNQQAAQIRAVGACNACARNGGVAQYKSECASGTMSACYRAAAALCECQLNSGGCGSNTQQLQQCVESNTSTADSMKGGYTIVPGQPSRPSSSGNQHNSPPPQFHCPPGGTSACANAAN